MTGLAIQKLLAGALSPADVDAFMSAHRFPLVEGPSVTFVFRGDVEGVNLRHWIYGLESSQPLTRAGDTDLFYGIVELPPESRVEYKLELFKQGKSWWVEDPLNPNRARDPFGANSVAHGEGYEIPTWTQPDPEARFGGVDVLLNNAGYGAYGALEATPMDVIRRQFDVNLFGLIATTKAVLPGMRARKSGVIVNVSSVGGRMCYPFGALYHGSKWAVEGLSEALHFELIRWGSG